MAAWRQGTGADNSDDRVPAPVGRPAALQCIWPHSARVFAKPVTSRAETLQSYIGGRKVRRIGLHHWLPISFNETWPSSPR